MQETFVSPIRKIKLFLPPIQSNIQNHFERSVMHSVSSLKEKHFISNQTKYIPHWQNPEIEYMSARDIDMVNRSYVQIKKHRNEPISPIQSEFIKDPLFKSIFDLKNKSLAQKRSKD